MTDQPEGTDPDDAEAWRLGEELDRAARDPGTAPDPDLLAAVADTATDEVLFRLLDALDELCAEGEPRVALHYADHLTALAPLLGRDGHRGVLAAVDVQTAGLFRRTGDVHEARRRAERCRDGLTDVLPGLLGDREWVLAGLAADDGRPGDALAHAVVARDLFAEHERWPEAALAAEAAAESHPVLDADAFADWRRAVDLYGAADEPDEARRCAELAAAAVGARLLEPHVTDDRALPLLCEQARELAQEHGHAEWAARLGLAVAEFAGDSDLPWSQVVARYARVREDLAVLGLPPDELRVDLARVDASLGRSAVAHQRPDEACELLSTAAATLRSAGADEDAATAQRMLTALAVARSPDTAAALLADDTTDPATRAALLLAQALQQAVAGDPAGALERIDEVHDLVHDPPADQVLLIDAVAAVARRGAGDPDAVPAALAGIQAALDAPDGLPRSTRARLDQVATLLRTDPHRLTDPAPVAAPPDVPDPAAELAAVRALAPDDPERGPRAAALVAAFVRTDPHGDPAALRPLAELLEIADGVDPEPPWWPRTRTGARLLDLQRRAAEGLLADPDAVAAELEPLADAAGGDPVLRPLVGVTRAVLRMVGALRHDDPADAAGRALAEVRTLFGGAAAARPEQLGPLMGALDALAEVTRGGDRTAQLREARRSVDRLPPGYLRDVFDEALTRAAGLDAVERLDDDGFAALLADVDGGGPHRPDPMTDDLWVGMRALARGEETDPARVEVAVAAHRRAVAATGSDHPHHVAALGMLALGLIRLHELTLDGGRLREAHDVLRQACTAAGGPQHPQWQMVNEMRADVLRLLGAQTDVARTAMDGLRRHVWQVLVQTDLASATAAVRRAGSDAVDAAVACLAENDPAAAISALDEGRGLALFAATEVRSVAARLDEAGETRLARRWRAAAAVAAATGDPDELPGDLRRTVLTALTAGHGAAALLRPPDLAEIQHALRVLDADALVYLVPARRTGFGHAITAAATGASYFVLPDLATAADPNVERYLTTLAERDAAAVRGLGRDLDTPAAGGAEPHERSLAASLDGICRWAWNAAMGPLVESYLPRLPRQSTDRPRRVVLVPMGDLARIPWHAARRPDGVRAVELVAVSQAASARMLCLSARRPPVPPSPVGLVVGDPDTTDPATGLPRAAELAAARLEAHTVWRAFYPGARYVGRLPDGSTSRSGPGSARQVRDWLTVAAPGAGTLLHLACHGVVEPGSGHASSYLLLADGERLTADELIEHMGRAADGRGVGLVVLAACRTGLAISGYDEAYSLGTAFLAGGADTVLSTQWSVPDDATSVLMFMFHHFLRSEGRPAWAALHAAQNWMLDPRRAVPATMPESLRRRLDPVGLADVAAWAAFVHWGR